MVMSSKIALKKVYGIFLFNIKRLPIKGLKDI